MRRKVNEQWASIPGFLGYEASSLGRVRSLDKYVRGRAGALRLRRGKVLSQHKAGRYMTVPMYRDGKASRVRVHRLVLEAFVGTRPVGMECCHRDCDSTNNALANLRWDTHTANVADTIYAGRRPVSPPSCPQGHPMSGRNLRINSASGYPSRSCRQCDNDAHNSRNKARRELRTDSDFCSTLTDGRRCTRLARYGAVCWQHDRERLEAGWEAYRALKAAETHCVRGHEFSVTGYTRIGRPQQQCRTCDADRARANRIERIANEIARAKETTS